jgi:membrane carboxypeptidase/penicillin-binding protein
MKSEGMTEDWVDQQRLAKAFRDAAEASMSQPYFSERVRQERAEYYRNQAERLEGKA